MEIKKELHLTSEEIEKIIKSHLSAQGYDVENICFDVREEEDPDDFLAELPLSSALKGSIAHLKIERIKNV